MLIRTIDFLKGRGITAFFTTLSKGGLQREESEVSISSLIDTWLHLRTFESGGERTRGLVVIKSRGMAHSNQVREFLITDAGLSLRDVYVGSGQVLMGAAREVQEAQDQESAMETKQAFERRQRELGGERRALEAQIEAMRLRLKTLASEAEGTRSRERLRMARMSQERTPAAHGQEGGLGKVEKKGTRHGKSSRKAPRRLRRKSSGTFGSTSRARPRGRRRRCRTSS